MPELNHVRLGSGPPLLLVHGLGGHWQSWNSILDPLSERRDVIAIDLPGHGESPETPDAGTFAGLADALEAFVREQGLEGIDAVGSSLGARLVLELTRRGRLGVTVALDPGGFWEGWERGFFETTILASIGLIRGLRPALPALTGSAAGRTALLAQLSAHPWRLPGGVVLDELRSYARTGTFAALTRDLAHGPGQEGATTAKPVVIGWGRHDRLCLPRQADRALARFPGARMHWFEHSGHFPHWDEPEEAVKLILSATT